MVETKQTERETDPQSKTKPLTAHSSGGPLASVSFSFPGTVTAVEAMVPDVGNDSIREEVLHALPLAQGFPDVGGTDLVLNGLPGQVNVVLELSEDGRVQDVPFRVMVAPAHTHQAKLLHYLLDVLVFPEVGGVEGLQDIRPTEEFQFGGCCRTRADPREVTGI